MKKGKMKFAINGLGRIGRTVLKVGLESGVNFVAVNDLTDCETLAYLLKHDSVYGVYEKDVSFGKDFIKIGGKKIKVLSEREPGNLPWEELGVDVVVESTGLFKAREDSGKHLKAGCKRVVISAPTDDSDVTLVLGVNEGMLKKSHNIISMASCTTNCLAPVAKILNDSFGIKKGYMTTVHAYTPSQNILDGVHKKVRRGRAGAVNIVPTTSGATSATVKVIPSLKGKLDGMAMRVPVACGSIVDFVVELGKKVSVEDVNRVLKKMARGRMKGILEYSEDELVSSDIIGNSHSAVVDGLLTQVIGGRKGGSGGKVGGSGGSGGSGGRGNLVKVLAWYDNEYGYSCRMVDLLKGL